MAARKKKVKAVAAAEAEAPTKREAKEEARKLKQTCQGVLELVQQELVGKSPHNPAYWVQLEVLSRKYATVTSKVGDASLAGLEVQRNAKRSIASEHYHAYQAMRRSHFEDAA